MTRYVFSALVALFLTFALTSCRKAASTTDVPVTTTSVPSPAAEPAVHAADDVAAGRYLVLVGGCNDCHTAGFMEQNTAIPEAQWLTGLPIGFRGPWGTTYPANLRLKVQDDYTEDGWVHILRTRKALPPMPWPSVNALSEQDARAIYRYIRSLGPAGQPAPAAVPPDQEPTTPYIDFVPQHMERLGAPAAPAEPAS